MKTLTKLYRWYWSPPLLHRERIERDFPSATIRKYEERDFESCREIYLRNEKGRFPENHVGKFETHLKNAEPLLLVLEREGEVIGTGGIAIQEFTDSLQTVSISFGLLHPDYHRQGYGMLMLAYRLSLVPIDRRLWFVEMTSAGNGTEIFFKNFGFHFVDQIEMEDGLELDSYYLRLPWRDIRFLRSRIGESPLTLTDPETHVIPRVDKRKEYEEELAKWNEVE